MSTLQRVQVKSVYFICYCKRKTRFLAMGHICASMAHLQCRLAKSVPLCRAPKEIFNGNDQTNLSSYEFVHLTNNLIYFIKLVFFFLDDCGDHVIVINTADIALPVDEWKKRVYFHHTGYPGGATWTLAWEMQEKDPTMV